MVNKNCFTQIESIGLLNGKKHFLFIDLYLLISYFEGFYNIHCKESKMKRAC